ncbi:MAG: phosphotransferase, partial [Chloroflexota bacterium]|nr:phosphotransferase [Chloroflexota bacterium]
MKTSSDEFLRYREAIEGCFPGFVVASAALAGEGMDNVALTVNDEYVFRFPKIAKAAAKVAVEAALLPELQERVDVRIPCPEFVGTDPRTGLSFSGYRRIDGVPLEPEVMFGLDPAVRAGLMEQIVRFIRQVHSFPVDRAALLGLRTNDYEAEYAGDLAQVRELVYPMLEQEEREYVERLYAGSLGDVRNLDFVPTVIHADLSPEHI